MATVTVTKVSDSEKKNFRGYVAFWSGQLVSTFGTSIVQTGIIIWITFTTGSPLLLGLAAFLAFGAQIALTPIAGVLIDRWSRKKTIAISDGLQAGAAFALIYLLTIGMADINTILMVLTFRGALSAFHDPAVQAIIPLMVPEHRLSRMNALTYLAGGLMNAIGFPIGGLLYVLLSGDLAKILWIDVVTFLLAVIPTVIVYIPAVKRESHSKKRSSFKHDFGEGLSFIRQKKGLLTLLSTFTIANFLLTPFGILLPLFTTQVLVPGDVARAAIIFGILGGLQQGSGLVAAAFMSAWKGFKRNVVGVVAGLLLGTSGTLLVSLSPNLGIFLVNITTEGILWLAVAGSLLVGLTVPIANVASQTIWQKLVPPEKLGRVFSVRIFIAQSTAPLAMILSGVMADFLGTQLVILFCAIAELAALGIAWSLTSLPHVEDTLLAGSRTPPNVQSNAKQGGE
jgi:DHA3 family macrolide efflux protein-like MFS transporter